MTDIYRQIYHEIYNRSIKDLRRPLDDVTAEVMFLFKIAPEDCAKTFLKIPINLRMELRKLHKMSESAFPKHGRSKEGSYKIYRNGKSKSWKVIRTGHGTGIIYYGSRKSKEEAEQLLKEVKEKETT